jgi:hypothetical protein
MVHKRRDIWYSATGMSSSTALCGLGVEYARISVKANNDEANLLGPTPNLPVFKPLNSGWERRGLPIRKCNPVPERNRNLHGNTKVNSNFFQ